MNLLLASPPVLAGLLVPARAATHPGPAPVPPGAVAPALVRAAGDTPGSCVAPAAVPPAGPAGEAPPGDSVAGPQAAPPTPAPSPSPGGTQPPVPAPSPGGTQPPAPGAPPTPAGPAAPTTPAGPAGPGAQEPVYYPVEGTDIHVDPETGLQFVTGNARVSHGTDELRATRITYNPVTRQFIAEGNVLLRQGAEEIRATRAVYSFETGLGEMDNARTVMGLVFMHAELLYVFPGPTYRGFRATMTTCDRRHPHYNLYARVVDIYPEDRLIARKVGADLLEERLFTLPRYEKSLVVGEEPGVYPSFGYNQRHGLFVEERLRVQRTKTLWLDGDWQLNTARAPSLALRAATPGQLQLVGSIAYRDYAENQRIRFMQVSRMPELGLVWTPEDEPRPGQFLATLVPHVNAPPGFETSRNWYLSGQLSAGYFLQHPGDRIRGPETGSRTGMRMTLQGQGILPVLKVGPLSLNRVRFMLRQQLYGTGDTFTVFGTGIGKRVPIGNFSVGIDRFDQHSMGHSPFFFDQVELKQEWRPSLRYHTRGFTFMYIARIRAESGELFDQVFSVSKLFHCIEPRLSFNMRGSMFFIDVSIPGLSHFSRRPGRQPQLMDVEETGP